MVGRSYAVLGRNCVHKSPVYQRKGQGSIASIEPCPFLRGMRSFLSSFCHPIGLHRSGVRCTIPGPLTRLVGDYRVADAWL
jgi:hypothetical protein